MVVDHIHLYSNTYLTVIHDPLISSNFMIKFIKYLILILRFLSNDSLKISIHSFRIFLQKITKVNHLINWFVFNIYILYLKTHLFALLRRSKCVLASTQRFQLSSIGVSADGSRWFRNTSRFYQNLTKPKSDDDSQVIDELLKEKKKNQNKIE